ncbi:MAG: endonuclease MutS2 [Balneolaceae bacterium]
MIYHPESLLEKIGFNLVRQETLKQAFTIYGKEVIEHHKATADPKELDHVLDLAKEWTDILQIEDTHPLSMVEDIRPLLRETKVEGSTLPLQYFPTILENARLARLIIQYFKRTEKGYETIQGYVNKIMKLQSLEKEIDRVVTENGTLRDDASQELKSIRGKINRKKGKLRSTINSIMKSARRDGMTSDEGPTIRNGRMVIPVQAEFKRKVDGFIHDVSATGQTIYVEPVQALQINNDIRELEAEEKREIDRIIRELTTIVRNHAEPLRKNCEIIGILDALHCRVKLGLDFGGTIPQYSDEGILDLISAKNPNLILKTQTENESEEVVPLNLSLDRKELALVITGPNAGGKSVAMKTVGLLCLMLQSGYPIPVQDDSTLPILSGLFVDVGDDQSIENDLSTFSSRLQWMKQTLDKIKPGALVLIDEAGTGTDPEEGGALFQSFIERLIEVDARVIVTTHHGSLKVFAHEHPSVVNGAMEFDQKNLSPTYRFRKGVPGSSYAFEIADRMDIPLVVMDRARKLLGEQRDKMGELLLNLEKKIQDAESMERELSTLKTKAAEEEKKLRNKNEDIDRKTKKTLANAYREAEKIMQTANQRIEAAVEKISSAGEDDREIIREARREILETKKSLHHGKADLDIKMEPASKSEKPKVGDFVTVGDGGTSGEVVDVSGKQVTILVNGMKIKSKLNKIQLAEPPKNKKKKSINRTYGGSENLDMTVKPKLDIRGYRGDDAMKELMHYLDKAVARGLQQVEIIHGKGEGILKKLVHEHLETRSEVKNFDIAPWEHGGPGCTLVELK